MGKEGQLLFWGGAFTRQQYISQARRVGMNIIGGSTKSDNPNLPYFDFKVIGGAALKSRLVHFFAHF
jgi:hypothetical protein